MSNVGEPTDMEHGQGLPDVGATDQGHHAEDPGMTYSSNISGSQVHSLAVGDQSHALTVIHHHGLSLTEAERLFGLLFEQNFPKLAEQARAEARRRVDEFTAIFRRVAAAQGVTEEQLGKLADPDEQFVLNAAVQASARQDNAETWEALAHLIARRLVNRDDDLEHLALGEAVSAAAKMTPRQLRIMALAFLVVHAEWFSGPITWETCNEYLEKMVGPFVPTKIVAGDLLHIGYAGCASVETGMHLGLSAVVAERYPDLFRVPSGPGLSAVVAERYPDLLGATPGLVPQYDHHWSAVINERSPILRRLCELPAPLPFHSMILTTVGVILATTVIEQVTGKRLPIDKWLG